VAEVIHEGDCRDVLRSLPASSVQTCITSPPYFGLRDYGSEDQIGLEPTPDEFVQALVSVFREVRRVLRDDGTVWLNLGDSYATAQSSDGRSPDERAKASTLGPKRNGLGGDNAGHRSVSFEPRPRLHGCKTKDLLGIPWTVAFALRADGWYLRSDIIWSKPNPMPESVTDRPTKAHEYLFLLSKSARYFYDADAIREAHQDKQGLERFATSGGSTNGYEPDHQGWVEGGGFKMAPGAREYNPSGRNRRSVWTVATQPYAGAHFATFPPKLIEPCILAGSAPGDVVLDPFAGAGTTGVVASWHGREFIGIELNPEYAAMARERIRIEGKPGGKTHEPIVVHADQLGLL
jgi:DNA modification methylase